MKLGIDGNKISSPYAAGKTPYENLTISPPPS